MRSILFAALVCAAPLALAQSQTTLYPGQSGASLQSSIRAGYTPSQTLGYNTARDQLYAYEQQTDGQLCGVYTQFCVQLTPGADPSTDAFNKGINAEHTWPQSRGASAEPARSDMHHLFPSKANVNSARGSDPLREIVDAAADTWYRGSASQQAIPSTLIGQWSEDDNASRDGFSGSFEPRDDHKGDAARALFYFRAIYDAEVGGAGAAPFFDVMGGDLIAWHYADPVSAEEAARSTWIAGLQGRQNPFILDSTLARRAFNLSAPSGGGGGGGTGGTLWVNELHYDNASTDQNEGVEVAGPAGTSLAGWSLVFYNGSGGAVYQSVALSGTVPDQQGGHGTVWVAVSGIQNGAPDGLALVAPDGSVAEFLSYEGTLTAASGPAAGMTSVDLGVSETSSTPLGSGLQLSGTGGGAADFAWGTAGHTRGAPNAGQTFTGGAPPAGVAWVNEFHYDNSGSDQNEGVEIAGTAGLDLSGWSVVFYNGNGGAPYLTLPLTGSIDDEGAGTGAVWFARSGIQNGGSDGFALVDGDGAVVQFLSYEGTLTASSGPAAGTTSTDVGKRETSSTRVGASIQLRGSGSAYDDFAWSLRRTHSRGSLNAGQTVSSAKTGAPLAEAPSATLDAALYPNPSAGRATVGLALAEAGPVHIELLDIRGRRVATVWDGPLGEGAHALPVDGRGLPAGIYVVRIQTTDTVATRRLTIAR